MKFTSWPPQTLRTCGLSAGLISFGGLTPNLSVCVNGQGDAQHRPGRVDCEVAFEPIGTDPNFELLFQDFLVPVSSPENATRLAKSSSKSGVEGFPIVFAERTARCAPRRASGLMLQGRHPLVRG